MDVCFSSAINFHKCNTLSCLPPQLTKRRWRRSQSSHSSALVCTPRPAKTSWVTLKVCGNQTEDFYLYSLCLNEKSHRDFSVCLSFLLLMRTHADMDIKPIKKQASGQAFEVILKPSSPVSDVAHCITSPPKRDLSLVDIQKKLEAAEDRRRVRMLPNPFNCTQLPRAEKALYQN